MVSDPEIYEGVSTHAVSDVPGAAVIPDLADAEPLFSVQAEATEGVYAGCRVSYATPGPCKVPR